MVVTPWEVSGVPVINGSGVLVVCATCPCGCTQCSTEAGTIDVEFASVAAGTCGACADLNTSTLTLTGGGSSCEWLGGGPCSVTVSVIFAAGRVICFVYAPGEIAEFEFSGSAPWDCTATYTLTFVDSTGAECDFTGATVVVNP